jgi:hypothetical protein
MRIVNWGQHVFVRKGVVSVAKGVEFASDQLRRGRWCDIIVVDVHAPTKDEIDGTQKRFYEELEHVLYKFT